MPSIFSALRTVCIVTQVIALSTFALGVNLSPDAPNERGLSIFYKIRPSDTYIYAFANGEFDKPPTHSYECGPDPAYPFDPPQFGCPNRAIPANTPLLSAPSTIFQQHHTPDPTCLSISVAYEHLQWATWTHACWAKPFHAIDSPAGHAEAAFQSRAVRYRRTVLYQHDKHLETLNRAMVELRVVADAELLTMKNAMAARVADVQAFYKAEMQKQGADKERLGPEQDEKVKQVVEEEQAKMKVREKAFWKDSWGYRWKTVEIDHLVGDYFEWWIRGWSVDELDWAGMGKPNPAFPPDDY